MAFTLVEWSLMFRRRKPSAFQTVIAVCLDHVRLSVIETPRYLLVLDVSSILSWIVYDVSLAFFGITLMSVHFPGLHSICQSLSRCSTDDKSDYTIILLCY